MVFTAANHLWQIQSAAIWKWTSMRGRGAFVASCAFNNGPAVEIYAGLWSCWWRGETERAEGMWIVGGLSRSWVGVAVSRCLADFGSSYWSSRQCRASPGSRCVCWCPVWTTCMTQMRIEISRIYKLTLILDIPRIFPAKHLHPFLTFFEAVCIYISTSSTSLYHVRSYRSRCAPFVHSCCCMWSHLVDHSFLALSFLAALCFSSSLSFSVLASSTKAK